MRASERETSQGKHTLKIIYFRPNSLIMHQIWDTPLHSSAFCKKGSFKIFLFLISKTCSYMYTANNISVKYRISKIFEIYVSLASHSIGSIWVVFAYILLWIASFIMLYYKVYINNNVNETPCWTNVICCISKMMIPFAWTKQP